MAEKNKYVDVNLNAQNIKRAQFETAAPNFDGHETRTLLERLVRLSGVIKSYMFRGDSIGLLGDVDVTTDAPQVGDRLRFDGTNWVPVANTHIIQLSGRFEIDVDYDWACWSDPNFGPSLQDWDLDLADNGVGGIPAIDWDGMGLAFPAGTILKRLFMKCRANNDDVDSIQTYVRMHDVDLTAGTAIDSNAEIGAVEISPITTFDLDAGAAQANDVRSIEIDLGDYVVQNDGADLHLMMKAVNGSLTGNRQIRSTVFIEVEYP